MLPSTSDNASAINLTSDQTLVVLDRARQKVGPASFALLYDLTQRDPEKPASLTVLTRESGLSKTVVQRSLGELEELDLIQVDRTRMTHRIQVVVPATGPYLTTLPLSLYTEVSRDEEEEEREEDSEDEAVSSVSTTTSPLSRERPRVFDTAWLCEEPPTERPKSILDPAVRQYVAWFEHLVTPTAKKKVTHDRRLAWYHTVQRMLVGWWEGYSLFGEPERHDGIELAELVRRTAWVFNHWGGKLLEGMSKEPPITRVAMIQEHWDTIGDAMKGKPFIATTTL